MAQMQMLDLELLVNSRYAFIAVTTDEEDRLQDMLVQDRVREFGARGTIRIDVSPADLERLARSLLGLTLFEAERAITRVVVEDMALTRSDCDARDFGLDCP